MENAQLTLASDPAFQAKDQRQQQGILGPGQDISLACPSLQTQTNFKRTVLMEKVPWTTFLRTASYGDRQKPNVFLAPQARLGPAAALPAALVTLDQDLAELPSVAQVPSAGDRDVTRLSGLTGEKKGHWTDKMVAKETGILNN